MYPTGRQDDQFQSCRKRQVADGTTTSPTLHFLVIMKPMSTNIFLQVAKKMWKSQGERSGLYGGCWGVSQPNLWSLSSPDWQYGDGRYHAKGWFRPTAFHGLLTLWLIAAPSVTKKRNTPLCSSLLAPFPMLYEHTLHYTYLQSNKETIVWTCGFSLCKSPNLQMAISIRNNSVPSFCEECVLWRMFGFHLTAPHILHYILFP